MIATFAAAIQATIEAGSLTSFVTVLAVTDEGMLLVLNEAGQFEWVDMARVEVYDTSVTPR